MLTMEQWRDPENGRTVYVMEIRVEGFLERRFLTNCDWKVDMERLEPVENGYKLTVEI